MKDINDIVELLRKEESFVCSEEYMKDVFNNLTNRSKTVELQEHGTTELIGGADLLKIYLPIMTHTLYKYQPSVEPKVLADELFNFIDFKIDEEDKTFEMLIPLEEGSGYDFSECDDIEAEILAYVSTKFYEHVLTL